MTKPKWQEQILLARLRAATTSSDVNQIFVDILKMRIERYHTQLRRTASARGRKLSLMGAPIFEQVLDHIESERVRDARYRRRLANRVLSETGLGTDADAIRALLGAVNGSSRIKKPQRSTHQSVDAT